MKSNKIVPIVLGVLSLSEVISAGFIGFSAILWILYGVYKTLALLFSDKY